VIEDPSLTEQPRTSTRDRPSMIRGPSTWLAENLRAYGPVAIQDVSGPAGAGFSSGCASTTSGTFAATMFATAGESTKEIMSRGGWRSMAMVVRYEHASEERDALLAQALNPYANGGKVVPIGIESQSVRARSAHDEPEGEGEVLALPSLTARTTTKAPGERLELST
jgi:hypothetical protein